MTINIPNSIDESAIAIIGMAGRFPGAKNIDEFWQNLRDGIDSISRFSEEELLASGVEPTLLNNPNYVKAKPQLKDIEFFDANLFDINAATAKRLDPQQRLFLESSWQALENAGYNPNPDKYTIGVYAGPSGIEYYLNNIYPSPDLKGEFAARLCSSQNTFATRIAYQMNLTGPAMTILTNCSTSLVAVHTACQDILNGECELAIAGGASVGSQRVGYYYEEGSIVSPDGYCRPFDAKGNGTLFAEAVGVVVLKRLKDAIEDGDNIHAVLKGSAVNNDGHLKVSYMAPSVDGQAEVIAMAQHIAEVDPETISYIEAHGTATAIGDPIEITALTEAFAIHTQKKNFCAIGAVKANIGHADAAAGITGLIKTVLAMKHRQIPPLIHFETPNPKIDFSNSPFYINTKLLEWKQSKGTPRRAGVSSFGAGGTNAHVILEEWNGGRIENAEWSGATPRREPPLRNAHQERMQNAKELILLSTKTATALDTATINLVNHFQENPEINLSDVAYTLSIGRKTCDYRRIVVVSELKDAVNALSSLDNQRVLSNLGEVKTRSVVFMFSGQGSQYVNMARELYERKTVFREQVDHCCDILNPLLELDLRDIIYPSEDRLKTATEKLKQTSITQPALFVIEYALAQLWMHWGLKPVAMIGHSIGEYVAATVAGVFSLEDALSLVTARGKLMQSMPNGSMLAVFLPEEEVKVLLENTSLEIAIVNSSSNCVVSGTHEAIASFEGQLKTQEIEFRLLHTSHAFHSSMMEPILETFTNKVKQITRNVPTIPFISNVTGDWIKPEEVTNPSYYAQHLRSCVRFGDGIKQLFDNPNQILLEVGAGCTLSTFAKHHPDKSGEQITLTSLPHPQDKKSDVTFLLNTLGKLWLAGLEVDWENYYGEQKHYRIPLPTYPFERKRYWIEPKQQPVAQESEIVSVSKEAPSKRPNINNSFYVPSWKILELAPDKLKFKSAISPILLFVDESNLGSKLITQLEAQGEEIIRVKLGEIFAKLDSNLYSIDFQNPDDYRSLIQTLQVQKITPKTIVHLWNFTDHHHQLSLSRVEAAQNLGFYSLLYLTQALAQQNIEDKIDIIVISNNLENVNGQEIVAPEKATLLGTVIVIPQEYSNINCRSVDLPTPESGNIYEEKLITQLVNEIQKETEEQIIAYRDDHRWVKTFEPISLEKTSTAIPQLKQDGVYLITGGLSGIGLLLAEYLGRTLQAKLILTGRSTLPSSSEWEQWLNGHGEEDPISKKIKKIQHLEKLGAQVLVISANVANLQQMTDAIALAQRQFGEINGVIHSAGIPGDTVIELKTKEMVDAILASKVQGTVVLDTLFKDLPLDFFIVCSSIASYFGNVGQVDYSAANNFLDAYAQSKSSQDDRLTISINWDTWQEMGMAVETEKQDPNRKILAVKKLNHALFHECIIKKDREIYISKLSPRTHWIVGEHIIMGKPTLVGTAYLEMARAAYECHSGQSTMEMQDVYFVQPLIIEEYQEKEVRTILTSKAEGIEFSIQSQDSNSEQWCENAKGKIVACHTVQKVQSNNIEELTTKCNQKLAVPNLQSFSESIQFGSRWHHNMKWRKMGQKEYFSLVELPTEFLNDLNTYKLHPAILDVAFAYTSDIKEGIYLPYYYEKIIIKGSLPHKFYTYATENEQNNSDIHSLNLSILDTQGQEFIKVDNYLLKSIETVSLADNIKPEQIENCHLEISQTGVLDELGFYPVLRQKPGLGEVEIEVLASGLNFKNVLQALGMIDLGTTKNDITTILGFECAGTISRIGEGVEGFNLGDQVICFTSSGFSSYVTTPVSLVFPKPHPLSLEEAVTIPIAFQTAYYMLREVGKLRRGERILIHAAAGGVGLAAVQIAQMIGAEIFATAGKPEKRDFLKSLGIKYVMDSRSLDFVEQVKDYTNGKGVDVVLNSLAGEFMFNSLSLLAPYGRFLELGIRDIIENTQLGLKAFEKGIMIAAFQVGNDAPNFRAVFEELLQHFENRTLSPLPYKAFSLTDTVDAFQYMAQAKHIGKIILSQNEEIRKQLIFEKPKLAQKFQKTKTHRAEKSTKFLQELKEYGILNQEGLDSFNRILNSGRSQVLVSKQDVQEWMQQINLPTAEKLENSSAQDHQLEPLQQTQLILDNEISQSQIEQKIVQIWQEVLGIENIGVKDNFFDLGGDSLVLIQLPNQIVKNIRGKSLDY